MAASEGHSERISITSGYVPACGEVYEVFNLVHDFMRLNDILLYLNEHSRGIILSDGYCYLCMQHDKNST
jgi:hypothetical protein